MHASMLGPSLKKGKPPTPKLPPQLCHCKALCLRLADHIHSKPNFAIKQLAAISIRSCIGLTAICTSLCIYLRCDSLCADQRALLKSLKPGVAGIAEITQPGNSCNIKGNISAQGRKLFFSPNSRGYDSVKIDTAAGERWFCNAAEAEEAGWRRPKY